MFRKLKLLLAARKVAGDVKRSGGVEKLKSRKFWITVAVGCVGVVANALGVTPEHWQPIADWLQNLLFGYLASQGVVDVAKVVAEAKAAKAQ